MFIKNGCPYLLFEVKYDPVKYCSSMYLRYQELVMLAWHKGCFLLVANQKISLFGALLFDSRFPSINIHRNHKMSSIKEFEYLRISLEVIKSATNNFGDTNYISRGGYGKVYKGELIHLGEQVMVAVKRLYPSLGQGT